MVRLLTNRLKLTGSWYRANDIGVYL